MFLRKQINNKLKYYIKFHSIKKIFEINKIYLILIFIFLSWFSKSLFFKIFKQIKIALCTMGRKENLYAQEFIDYYIKIGIDHIFIYDDNDKNTEKISIILNPKYKQYVTVYENLNKETKYQSGVYNNCYRNNNKKCDWLLMIDMDEFLYIKRFSLKNYLSKSIFKKCDFIKFNWVIPTDNNLIHYDNRPLFERFPGPYIKSIFVKSIIRGNIPKLQFMVHSPIESPIKNTTCDNQGKKIFYKLMNFEYMNINIKEAYIIHFKYKSTEEYINKYKRGYHLWKGEKLLEVLYTKIIEYLKDNEITLEKLDYFERELNLNLTKYKKNYFIH